MIKLNIGNLVRFNYFGGSSIGATRIVRVEEVRDAYIIGRDTSVEDANNVRRYNLDKVKHLFIVS